MVMVLIKFVLMEMKVITKNIQMVKDNLKEEDMGNLEQQLVEEDMGKLEQPVEEEGMINLQDRQQQVVMINLQDRQQQVVMINQEDNMDSKQHSSNMDKGRWVMDNKTTNIIHINNTSRTLTSSNSNSNTMGKTLTQWVDISNLNQPCLVNNQEANFLGQLLNHCPTDLPDRKIYLMK